MSSIQAGANLIIFLFFLFSTGKVYSQNFGSKKYNTVSTPTGVPFSGTPKLSPDSERIKINHTIAVDSAWVTLYFKEYNKDRYVPDDTDRIIMGLQYNATKIITEIVIDLTDCEKLQLQFNLGRLMRFHSRKTSQSKCFKLVHMKSEGKLESFMPIVLLYEDSESNDQENILHSHLQNGFFIYNDNSSSAINQLDRCLLIYLELKY